MKHKPTKLELEAQLYIDGVVMAYYCYLITKKEAENLIDEIMVQFEIKLVL